MRRAKILSCLLWTSVAACGETDTFTDAGPTGPRVDFATAAITFGEADCGTTPDAEALEVTNVGDAEVEWSAEIEGTGFTIDGAAEGTVAPGATASITIVPDPIAATAIADEDITATLHVTTNTAVGTVDINLKITPRGSEITISPALADFGTTPVSTSATDVPVTITNNGNGAVDLVIDDVTTDEFALTYPGSPGSVHLAAGGGSFTMTADFNPLDTGGTRTSAAAFQVTGAQCAGATEVPLTGISSTGTLSFGAFPAMTADCGAATPGDGTLTITNTSTTSSVTISSADATDGFTVTSTLPMTIAANSTGTLSVRPPVSVIGTDVGGATKTGTLSFTTNEDGNPTHTAGLTSTVVGANIVFTQADDTTPITSVSLESSSGCPSTQTVWIRNTGNAPVEDFVRTTGNPNLAFHQSPSSAIAGGDFTSTAIGAFTSSACEATDTIEYTWSTGNVCTVQPAVLDASFSVSGQSFCFCS